MNWLTRATTLVVVLLMTGLAVAWAGPSRADDVGPASGVTVPEQAPAAEETESPKPDTHAHAVGQPPHRSAKEFLNDVWTRDKLSGDWGGLRTDLAEHGVYPRVRFTQIVQGVATGGADTGGRYGGLVDWWLNVDASKAAGLPWKGLAVSLHAQTRYGKDINAEAGDILLPNAPMLYPLPGDYDGTDVTGLMVEQALFDGKVDVFFGKLNAIDLWTGFYPNVGYGLDGFLNVNALASGWPFLRYVNLGFWGGGTWMNNSEGEIQTGFIFFGQANNTTSWSFDGQFDDGVGLLGFYRFFWDFGGMPGSLLIAGIGATKEYNVLEPSVYRLDPSTELIGPGISDGGRPWGWASYLYQEFWHGSGDKGRKAYLYMGGGMADKDPSFARWNIFASVEAIGLLPTRQADRTGFAGWYNQMNDSFKDELALLGRRAGNSWGVELYYNVAINKWLRFTADLQLAQNANKDDNLAVIPGGRLVLEF